MGRGALVADSSIALDFDVTEFFVFKHMRVKSILWGGFKTFTAMVNKW